MSAAITGSRLSGSPGRNHDGTRCSVSEASRSARLTNSSTAFGCSGVVSIAKCVRDDRRMESRHVSVWIEADAQTVYEFAADPQTWPKWAAGLAEGGLRQTVDGWVA